MSKLREIISTKDAPPPMGLYSQAIRTRPGQLIYLAGQLAVDLDGAVVGEGDVGAQTRQVLENIGAVLAAAGASFSNVVEFTTYVVGRESIAPFIEARTALFQRSPPAPATCFPRAATPLTPYSWSAGWPKRSSWSRSRLFPEGGYPPNTLLVVGGLAKEEFLVEIKAVAALS